MTTIESRTEALSIPVSDHDLPMRFGFAAKVLGQEGLKSMTPVAGTNDRTFVVSIGYLHEIFTYLEKSESRCIACRAIIAPYVTHPDMPQFHGQITEAAKS
jgi:UV DNA damage endonuclease